MAGRENRRAEAGKERGGTRFPDAGAGHARLRPAFRGCVKVLRRGRARVLRRRAARSGSIEA
ncbi:hypothetical protein Ssi03_35960 [Sphaerisporangium siamense]|nr:hypothetical protein Ssi03_35960 [Sphaerisporangium siamense]